MHDDKEPFDRDFESLTALADAISEALLCPVTIEDANHRLIAYSSHDPQTDPVRIETIISRRVPEKAIRALWQEGVMARLNESDEPIRVSAIHDIGLGDRLAIAIRKKNVVLGYIWVLDMGKRLDHGAMVQLKKAANAAKAHILELQMKSRKEEKENQDFFWQLLTGHYQSVEMIKDKADQLGVALPAGFVVITVEFEDEISEDVHQQIRYLFNVNLPGKVVFHIINRNLLIVFTAQGVAPIIEQLMHRFGSAVLNAGAGLPSDHYMAVEKTYQESLLVLRMKKHFPHELHEIYEYANLGFWQFIPKLIEERREHEHENSCIRKLKSYDREHHANLLHTLQIFLANDSNLKKTADVLHVHTNTLNYRLKRIAEIGEIDLDDMNQKITIYLELLMQKLAGPPVR